jgi:general secretion pathway protein J
MSRVAGFTLVELLVAVLLFALLSAAAAGLLRFGIDARGATFFRLDALAATTRTRALLAADLGQAAARPWRDETGVGRPAFIGNTDGILLHLVRRGWRNDGQAPRASLQRVEYRLSGDRLERRSWPMVDGAVANPPATMISGITELSIRFHSRGQWRDRWDPERRDQLPDAVELIISAPASPTLRQAFLVGPGPVVEEARAP